MLTNAEKCRLKEFEESQYIFLNHRLIEPIDRLNQLRIGGDSLLDSLRKRVEVRSEEIGGSRGGLIESKQEIDLRYFHI